MRDGLRVNISKATAFLAPTCSLRLAWRTVLLLLSTSLLRWHFDFVTPLLFNLLVFKWEISSQTCWGSLASIASLLVLFKILSVLGQIGYSVYSVRVSLSLSCVQLIELLCYVCAVRCVPCNYFSRLGQHYRRFSRPMTLLQVTRWPFSFLHSWALDLGLGARPVPRPSSACPCCLASGRGRAHPLSLGLSVAARSILMAGEASMFIYQQRLNTRYFCESGSSYWFYLFLLFYFLFSLNR